MKLEIDKYKTTENGKNSRRLLDIISLFKKCGLSEDKAIAHYKELMQKANKTGK